MRLAHTARMNIGVSQDTLKPSAVETEPAIPVRLQLNLVCSTIDRFVLLIA